MFTGIIQVLGVIISNLPSKDGKTLIIKTSKKIHANIGDSIAIDGCCLTVIATQEVYITFYISRATLDITTLGLLEEGARINVEPAMFASSPLGGHLVSGHVDEVGKVVVIKNQDNTHTVRIQIKEENIKYVVEKGSITINGVSLTIMKIISDIVDLNIIPHTWENTNLCHINTTTNSLVNIEYDQIVKIISNRVDAYIESRI